MQKISNTVKENPKTSITLASVVTILTLFFTVDDRYVNASEFDSYKVTVSAQDNREKRLDLEDKIFELRLRIQADPNNRAVYEALIERYGNRLNSIPKDGN